MGKLEYHRMYNSNKRVTLKLTTNDVSFSPQKMTSKKEQKSKLVVFIILSNYYNTVYILLIK